MQNLILFIKSDEAHRVMSAWPMMDVQCKDRPLKHGEDFQSARDTLWLETKVNLDALADQADVPRTRCDRMFNRLVRANIIYPDGTISPHASNLLVTKSIAHIKSQTPRGRAHEGSRINPAGESVPKSDNDGLSKGPVAEPGADKVRRAPARKPGSKAR